MPKTAEELVEEVKGLVSDIQTENESKSKEYGTSIAENDTAIKAMETKFGELTETIQTKNDEADAIKKEVEELTLQIARGANVDEKTGELMMSDAVKTAFSQALREEKSSVERNGDVMKEVVGEHVKAFYSHLSADRQADEVKTIMSQGSHVAGGMLCPVPVSSRITKRRFEISPMRQMANVQNISTSGMDFVLDDDELQAETSGEVDTRSETDGLEFGSVRIDAHELYAKPKVTQALLEDSAINLENFISDKAAKKFARKQNQQFVTGTGIKEAKGILTYGDADVEVYERGKIGTMDTATTIVLAGDDFIDLQSHVVEEYQESSQFAMNRLIWAKTVKLKDNEDRYLLDPLMLFNGSKPQLLGKTVRMFADMPAPTSAGALVAGTVYVCYGDFNETYTIVDRLGINVIMDNITESGFVKYFFRTRSGGGVTNFQSLKRLKAKA